jgi:transposase
VQRLELWEQELRTLLEQRGTQQSREMKSIRKELKLRDKELQRKDKALAELSTIIALQKKTSLLFQDPEDD